jgi:hypothetical protein
MMLMEFLRCENEEEEEEEEEEGPMLKTEEWEKRLWNVERKRREKETEQGEGKREGEMWR